jgi:hypothetical protein
VPCSAPTARRSPPLDSVSGVASDAVILVFLGSVVGMLVSLVAGIHFRDWSTIAWSGLFLVIALSSGVIVWNSWRGRPSDG